MVGLRPITFIFKTQRAKWTFAAVDQNVCYADKTDIHFPAFADAAFPRKCGTLIAALRPMSPDRPLKASLRREFKQPFRCSRAKVYSRFSARIEKTH